LAAGSGAENQSRGCGKDRIRVTLHVAKLGTLWYVLDDKGTPKTEGCKKKGEATALLYKIEIGGWSEVL
jgi:hypothetical protein